MELAILIVLLLGIAHLFIIGLICCLDEDE